MVEVSDLLRSLKEGRDAPVSLSAQHTVPARPAQFDSYPDWIHPDLRKVLQARGISQLYAHQRRAAELLHDGKNVVVATPTASGKSLCYHLPVLDRSGPVDRVFEHNRLDVLSLVTLLGSL